MRTSTLCRSLNSSLEIVLYSFLPRSIRLQWCIFWSSKTPMHKNWKQRPAMVAETVRGSCWFTLSGQCSTLSIWALIEAKSAGGGLLLSSLRSLKDMIRFGFGIE